MVNNLDNLGFTCCFCGKGIASSNKGNPCEIDILSDIDKSKERQKNQTFWCHIECVKEKMCPEVRYHFMLDIIAAEDDEAPGIESTNC